ncbi:uncharacterized protein TNIN_213101 [Trichonephila inaurata madagascariensis]|uniref:TIL domain-containing protein n=1 Tax=Trichonephila inaurata madagascariensis TaxID=2747483 RepID=A0A8X6XNW4_9ARAC|nr:uncharacterized protein TNIN_213101 [Trichonephila inaurata madagascariensis]
MATVNSLLYLLLTFPPTPESVTTEINRYDWKNEETTIISQSYLDPITERPEISASLQRIKCKSNETFSKCNYLCQKNCDNYDKPFPCPRVCVWGCICKEGYVRGPNKNCIKIEDCGSKPEQKAVEGRIYSQLDHSRCPTNERWDDCSAHCQKNCSQFNDDIPCKGKCTRGCVCMDGYVRGQGKCILPYECKKKSESNQESTFVTLDCNDKEYFDLCPTACPSNCNNFRTTKNKCFPFICIPGCVCKGEYVRGPNGKCIKSHDCPKEKNFCPDGEEYSPCESHCEGNCLNKGNDIKCISNGFTCVSGCKCKKGLNPVKKCPSNEEYTECSAGCQQNCTNVDSPIPCRKECLPGCVCKENFIRGINGKCGEPTDCPKTDSPGEIYESTEIQTEVSTLRSDVSEKVDENPQDKEDQLPVCGANEEGYVIGPNKKCIKKEECPGNRNCPAGELYSKCNANCQKNCSNWAYDLICPKKCEGGCVCKSGLIRGPDKKCTYWFKCPLKSSPSDSWKKVPLSSDTCDQQACEKKCTEDGYALAICRYNKCHCRIIIQ